MIIIIIIKRVLTTVAYHLEPLFVVQFRREKI